MFQLNPNQKGALRRSSRQAIEESFEFLQHYFPHDRWLGANNRYLANCLDKLKQDSASGNIVNKHLAEYIAASTILHCVDGWVFLGKAVNCLVHGDNDVARHMGYYAELRAAMSVLAAEGIGIFSGRHYVVESKDTCRKIPGNCGTHQIVWPALDYWATEMQCEDLLLEIISPAGHSLKEWLRHFGGALTVGLIGQKIMGKEWLRSWGLDLERLSKDYYARNESSYRPTRIKARRPLESSAAAEFVKELWKLCNPSGPTRFEVLDRYLLRETLELAYKATSGSRPNKGSRVYVGKIDSMLSNITPVGYSSDEWRKFLLERPEPDIPKLIVEASKRNLPGHPQHHLQVAARAFLLLRIASGACSRLLKIIGLQREDLEFWWKPLGVDRGLWGPGDEVVDLTDFWADAEAALEDLNAWETRTSETAAHASFASWQQECCHSLGVLSGCERIALWGLGI